MTDHVDSWTLFPSAIAALIVLSRDHEEVWEDLRYVGQALELIGPVHRRMPEGGRIAKRRVAALLVGISRCPDTSSQAADGSPQFAAKITLLARECQDLVLEMSASIAARAVTYT